MGAEKIIGKIFQPTGQDLFFDCANNANDKNDETTGRGGKDTNSNENENNLVLIERMTLEDRFVKPLSLFKKRIAYANAYGTDFQVPTNTAAFLSNTNSIHKVVDNHIEENDDDNNETSSKPKPKILLTVE